MPLLAQATPSNMSTIALTLEELLALDGDQFINCAYRTLLGRAPDLNGFNYYSTRRSIGYSKIGIIAQLHISKEGATRSTHLPGLDTAVRNHKRGQYPLIGWLFRQFSGTEVDNPTERKLRAIENQLFLLRNESTRHLNEMEITLTDLYKLSLQRKLFSDVNEPPATGQKINVVSVEQSISFSHHKYPSKTELHLDKLMQRIWKEIINNQHLDESRTFDKNLDIAATEHDALFLHHHYPSKNNDTNIENMMQRIWQEIKK